MVGTISQFAGIYREYGNDRGTILMSRDVYRRLWQDDAVTAVGLFLRPGDEAGVSQVALLFSDLQGSTALYERVGDAVAFNMVREHFALLASIVRDHDGAVVKTIGDAVMASFGDPANAVKAALAMQARIADQELVLKLGVHVGPSVVVNLNDRLDYFGSTVNTAARLQGQSHGGDVVLSETLAADPAVAALLADRPRTAERAQLKGLADAVPFERLHARGERPAQVLYGYMPQHGIRNVAAPQWLLFLAAFTSAKNIATPYSTLDDGGRLVRHPPQAYPRWPLVDRSAAIALLEWTWLSRAWAWRLGQQDAVTRQLIAEMAALCRAHGVRLWGLKH